MSSSFTLPPFSADYCTIKRRSKQSCFEDSAIDETPPALPPTQDHPQGKIAPFLVPKITIGWNLFTWEESIPPIKLHFNSNYRKFRTLESAYYPAVIATIRCALAGRQLYACLSIDEYDRTHTLFSELLVNILIGPLGTSKRGGPPPEQAECYLLKSVPINGQLVNPLTRTAYEPLFLVHIFEEAMDLLWPHVRGHRRSDLLLLLTDYSSSTDDRLSEYMQTGARALTALYPRLLHLPDLSVLLTQLKGTVISRSFTRLGDLYRRMSRFLAYASLDFPLNGAQLLELSERDFLSACDYYLAHYETIQGFFSQRRSLHWFDSQVRGDYIALKDVWEDGDGALRQELILVKSTFAHSIRLIQNRILQRPVLSICETLRLLETFKAKLEHLGAQNPSIEGVSAYLNDQLGKMRGYQTLKRITRALSRRDQTYLTLDTLKVYQRVPLGGINRRRVFPHADQVIRCELNSFPLRFIDAASVIFCNTNRRLKLKNSAN